MAIQSLTGNMTTNQFGGNIVCQGATLTFSPFVTFGANYRKPFNHVFHTPVYDPTDLIGDFDDDGNPTGDGVPDNAGDILYYEENYSGTNKDSFAVNTGFSLNFTVPLDKRFQSQCSEAATTQVKIQKQILRNKELDWAIARIKECGKLKQEGILISKKSEFFDLCSDIYIDKKPNQVIPHTHKLR